MNRTEEYRQQLVANEISFGFTLIESARLSHSMGHPEHRDSAHAKAEAAYSEAQHFLAGQSGSGWDHLGNELQRLRVALDALPASFSDVSSQALDKAGTQQGLARPGKDGPPEQERTWREKIMLAQNVIVIGASSGGVDALQRLVRDLSPDLPAALFVVLHIGVQPSVLPEILSRAGPLPAVHALDGGRPEQGRIYIAPPDHHLVLAPGHMHVTRGPKENHARPSIDTLFRTAANAYGSRVVGVVLTGNLNDGTVGLWEIQRHGGVTVVQNPAEAAFPSMPQSALENVPIDYSVNLCQAAALLGLLASGTMKKRMETHPETNRDARAFSGLTCPECRGPCGIRKAGKVNSSSVELDTGIPLTSWWSSMR